MHDLLAQRLDLHRRQQVLAAQRGRVVERSPGARYHLFGNRNQGPVGRRLARFFALTLPRRHALYI
jgi:hypothetical protein